MGQTVKGSFYNTGPSAIAASPLPSQVSASLDIHTYKGLTGTFQLKLTIPNNVASGGPSTIDASNTCKTQKSLDSGITWSDVTTYNSAQNGTLVTVVGDDNIPTPGEMWRVALVTLQAGRCMEYELSIENFKYTTGSTYV